MKKRLLSLLVLTVVLMLAIAPAALADHCRKCSGTIPNQTCGIAVTGGKPICYISNGTCVLEGLTCTGPHPFIDADDDPLGADFFVASVERLDEAQPAASETRIASLELPQPAQR
ncbi:MAG: hypothetical protein QOH21_889 [Acidobacteriota bacterium]|jgi:hypothetical protein|nr:hypothetical protein [Acidobacteriota bacterium]